MFKCALFVVPRVVFFFTFGGLVTNKKASSDSLFLV